MATSLAACDRIFAAAKQAGTVFMLAENAQYWPEIIKAQELIEQGAIGDVITAARRLLHAPGPVLVSR